jgi:serine/threonine protein phosphatase PrpC
MRSLTILPRSLVRCEGHDKAVSGVMPLAGGAAAFYSAPRPGGTGRSQDAVMAIPLGSDRGVIAVADGMGGLPGGREAAAMAIGALIDGLCSESAEPVSVRTRIMDSIEMANQRILATGIGSATTLAVAEIGPGTVRAYHVGDSEIMAFGQRGRVKIQSVPHSPVGFAYHAGMLDETQAITHEDRHLVSNVLGIRDMRIEVGSVIPFALHDTVVVCSDGLVDNLQFEEISAGLRQGRLDRAVLGLAAKAYSRMTEPVSGEPSKPDDLSLIAYRRSPGSALTRRLYD